MCLNGWLRHGGFHVGLYLRILNNGLLATWALHIVARLLCVWRYAAYAILLLN